MANRTGLWRAEKLVALMDLLRVAKKEEETGLRMVVKKVEWMGFWTVGAKVEMSGLHPQFFELGRICTFILK